MNPQTIDLAEVTREERLIESLLRADPYPHDVGQIQLLDTHISWVILTGPFAYKIKKPIKLEFLDYSTLERRKHFCEEELRLNRRFTPELYIDVVPICGSFENPVVGGDGTPVEYAVKMVEFPQNAQLDVQVDTGRLMEDDMVALAETIAGYHGAVPVCDWQDAGEAYESIRHPMLENFNDLAPHVGDEELQPLEDWTRDRLEVLRDTLMQRQDEGFIRECHGDLKLANLVRLPSGISAFDCVEFSAELRDVDVISDISFLIMDLIARKRRDLAFTFISRYLECTGDYAGMSVFRLYFVYHALIRAKIAAIRSVEQHDEIERQRDLDEMALYVRVARIWTEPRRPHLIVMHGLAGSGKSSLSRQIVSRLPAIRVRSDVERRRLAGLAEDEASGAGVGEGIYAPQARHGVYESIAVDAKWLLGAGHNVIADASFLNREDRRRFQDLAAQMDTDWLIVSAAADRDTLRRRLRRRQFDVAEASEAGVRVLDYQIEHAETLDDGELEHTIVVDTEARVDMGAIIAAILARN